MACHIKLEFNYVFFSPQDPHSVLPLCNATFKMHLSHTTIKTIELLAMVFISHDPNL